MNNKFYVSLEVARLLKEKGYDRECISYYHDNCREVDYSFCCERNSTWEERCVSAPTKAEAIDWLESKGIGISIIFCEIDMYEYVVELKDCYYNVVESGYKETRLEAEEAAIIGALKLL